MSLLDQLTSYRCKVDQFSSQLLFLEEESTSFFQQQRSKSKFEEMQMEYLGRTCSEKWQKCDKIERESKIIMNEQRERREPIGYQQIYTKMSRFVDMFEAKIRKLNYEFIICLERTSITSRKQLPIQKPDLFFKTQRNSIQSARGSLEKFTHLIQLKSIGTAFRQIISFGRLTFSVKLIVKFLLNMQKQEQVLRKSNAFEALTKFVNKKHIMKIAIKQAKSINLSGKLKSTKVKTFLHQQPYLRQLVENESSIRLNNPSYPHYRQEESLDYYDNVALFLTDNQHFSTNICEDYRVSKESSHICMSVLSLKKEEQSPTNSIIKNLSEFELNTNHKFSIKRNNSVFTTVSGFISQNVSEYDCRTSDFIMQAKINSENNKVNQHQQNFKKKQSQNSIEKQQTSNIVDCCCKNNLPSFQNSNKQQNIVNSLTNLRSISSREGLPYFDYKIEQEMDQKVSNYVEFRKSIEKRRESTLRQIQRSKSMIKKLMSQFKKNKESMQKTKILIKKTKSKHSTDPRKHSKSQSKEKSPNKFRTNINSRQGSLQKKNDNLEGKSNENRRRAEQNSNSFKTMQVYYNYMKQKKKMSGSLNKSETKRIENNSFYDRQRFIQHVNLKKTDLPKKPIHNYKNLLSISNFAETKQQRIQLRVDLTKRIGQKDKLKEKNEKKKCGK